MTLDAEHAGLVVQALGHVLAEALQRLRDLDPRARRILFGFAFSSLGSGLTPLPGGIQSRGTSALSGIG